MLNPLVNKDKTFLRDRSLLQSTVFYNLLNIPRLGTVPRSHIRVCRGLPELESSLAPQVS